jgi:glycerol-3-phosphate acyltransferase PlsY
MNGFDAAYFPQWLILAYIMGSCPTGYVIVKLVKGEDIRKFGSGNIGATNVARVLGKKWAVATAVIDMLKGGAAILLAMAFGHREPALLAAIGAMGVIGHDYPVWIGFKGGKGVATTFGVISCFDFFNPIPSLVGGVVWFAAREISCIVSLSSMTALWASAALIALCGMPVPYIVCGIFLAALTTWRHRENIKRIIAGNENKVNPFFPKRTEDSGKPS